MVLPVISISWIGKVPNEEVGMKEKRQIFQMTKFKIVSMIGITFYAPKACIRRLLRVIYQIISWKRKIGNGIFTKDPKIYKISLIK